MSAYTDAMHEFVSASTEYTLATEACPGATQEVEEAAHYLAQAGDVLEREVRQVVREEVQRSGRVSGVWGRVASQQMPFPGEP